MYIIKTKWAMFTAMITIKLIINKNKYSLIPPWNKKINFDIFYKSILLIAKIFYWQIFLLKYILQEFLLWIFSDATI